MKHSSGAVSVLDLEPAASDFLEQAIAGLSSSPRTLPSKFFYDERGSDLFREICELPEYYVTRTETEILRRMRRKWRHRSEKMPSWSVSAPAPV